MKNKVVIVGSLILSACGSGNRGITPDQKKQAGLEDSLKGIVYLETDAGKRSTEIRESDIVLSTNGKITFDKAGSSITETIYNSKTASGFGVNELNGTRFFIAPHEVFLSKTSRLQTDTLSNPKQIELGVFSIGDYSKNYKLKLSQEWVGNIVITEEKIVTQYNSANGNVIRIAYSKNVPIKSRLMANLISDDKVSFAIAIDKSEEDAFNTYRSTGSEISYPSFGHELCNEYDLTESYMGSQPVTFRVSCDFLTDKCNAPYGVTLCSASSEGLTISALQKVGAKCRSPVRYEPADQIIPKEIKLHIQSGLQALQLVPRDAIASANTKLLFQEFTFDSVINFQK